MNMTFFKSDFQNNTLAAHFLALTYLFYEGMNVPQGSICENASS